MDATPARRSAMSGGCGNIDPEALVLGLLGTGECRARALGSEGWHALAASGTFATVLTGLLTLAVARQGYRLLVDGGGLAPADWAALILRFGVVIALCTSWPAYDRMIYRVAMEGPAEIAAILYPAAGIETRSLDVRLQNAYDAIGTPPDPATSGVPVVADRQPPADGIVSPGSVTAGAGLPGTDRRSAAMLLVVFGAGSWIAARLALALLLAIGPFAIVTALFDVSAGIWIGWARAVIGTALAGLVIPLALAFELEVLEGPVRATAKAGLADVPGLGAIVWSFVLVIAALVFVVHRVAGGLRLPRAWMPGVGTTSTQMQRMPATADRSNAAPGIQPSPRVPHAPSRAMAIVQAAEARTRTAGATSRSPISATGAIAANTVVASPSRRGTDIAAGAQRSATGRRPPSTRRLEAQ